MTAFPGSAAMRFESPNGGWWDFNAVTTEILTEQEKNELAQRFNLIAEITRMLSEGGWGAENMHAAQNMLRALNQLPVSSRLTIKQIDKLLKEIDGTKLTGEKSQTVQSSMQQYKQHLEQLKSSLQNKQEQKKGLQNPSQKTESKIEKSATLKVNVKALNDILNRIPESLRTPILAALKKEGRPLTAANLVGALAASKDPKAAATIGGILAFLVDKGFMPDFNRAIKALAENKNPQIVAQVVEALAKDNRSEVATKTATGVIDVLAKISPELAAQTAAAVIDKITVSHPEVTAKIISSLADTHPEILKTATLSLADDGKIPAVAAVLNVVAEKPELTAQFVNALESKHQDVLKAATLALTEDGKIMAVTAVLGAMTDSKLATQTATLVADKLATTAAPEVTAKFIASLAEKQPDITRNVLTQMADKQPAIVQQIAKTLATVDPKAPVHAIMDGVARMHPDILRAAPLVNSENGKTPSNVTKADFKGAASGTVGDNRAVPPSVQSSGANVISFPSKGGPDQPRNFGQAPSTAPDTGATKTSGSFVNKGYEASPSFSEGQSPTPTGAVGGNPSVGTPPTPVEKVGGTLSTGTVDGASVAAGGVASPPLAKSDTAIPTAGNDADGVPTAAKPGNPNVHAGVDGNQPVGNGGAPGNGATLQDGSQQVAGNDGHTPPPAEELPVHPEQWNRTERETTVDPSVRETEVLQATATGKDASALSSETPENIAKKDSGVGSSSDSGDAFAEFDFSSVDHGTAPEIFKQSIDKILDAGGRETPTLFDGGVRVDIGELSNIKPPPRPGGSPPCCPEEPKPK